MTKGDDCKGIKIKKDRITLLLCCSMSGEKQKPFIIGKSKNPRCFRNVDFKKLKVTYGHSPNAWMNGALFKHWMAKLNDEMKLNDRHILLIVDNAPSHVFEEFSNIEMLYLPKNTTPLLQPLDMGIIKAFKNHYQNYLLEKFILNEKDDIGSNISSVNMLETIYFCSMAWESITCNSIQNCFEKAFNFSQNYSTEISSLELTNAVINNELENMLDDVSDVSNTSSDEDDIDDGISLSQIHSIMKSMEDYLLKFNGENIINFIEFRHSILKSLKKKYAFGTKITHFLNKI